MNPLILFIVFNLTICQLSGQKFVCIWEVFPQNSYAPKYILDSTSGSWYNDSIFFLNHSEPGRFYCIYRGSDLGLQSYSFPDDSVLNLAGDTTFFYDIHPKSQHGNCPLFYDSLPDGQWIKVLRDSFGFTVIVEKMSKAKSLKANFIELHSINGCTIILMIIRTAIV